MKTSARSSSFIKSSVAIDIYKLQTACWANIVHLFGRCAIGNLAKSQFTMDFCAEARTYAVSSQQQMKCYNTTLKTRMHFLTSSHTSILCMNQFQVTNFPPLSTSNDTASQKSRSNSLQIHSTLQLFNTKISIAVSQAKTQIWCHATTMKLVLVLNQTWWETYFHLWYSTSYPLWWCLSLVYHSHPADNANCFCSAKHSFSLQLVTSLLLVFIIP